MATSVLLIRTNAHGELFNTRDAVAVVRARLGATRVVALATPQSEGRALLEADARLDGVLLFPPHAEGAKSPGAFHAFIRRQHFDAVVTCVGATPGMDYSRHLLSALLCRGRKYLLDASGDIHPVFSLRGAATLMGGVSAAAGRAGRVLGGRLFGHPARGHRLRAPDLCPERVRRILWIRVDGIGDVAMTLPALAALQARFPQARVDLLVRPASVPLVEGLPGVGRVYSFEPREAPRSTRSPGRHSLWALALRLRANRYDLAVDPAGRDVARVLAWCGGARARVSPAVSPYDDPALGSLSFLVTHPITLHDARTRPAADNFLDLVQRLGALTPRETYRLPVTEAGQAALAEKRRSLGLTRPYALLHARSAEEAKDWRPERFAAVAVHLMDVHGLDVVLTGTARDWDYNARIIADIPRGDRAFNAAGAFGLAELPSLCRQADLMVTVDTGPMHIAAMVGTPVVALFLPWFVRRDGPYGQADGVLVPFHGLTVPAERAPDFWAGHLLNGISVADVNAMIDRKRASAVPPDRSLPMAA